MERRNFDEWFDTFRNSINGFSYYVDVEKVIKNAREFEFEINLLNCLLGAKNIEEKFVKLIIKYPDCLKVIPILLAVRKSEIYCQDENVTINYRFDKQVQTIDQYVYFMKETGLFKLLQEQQLNGNLYTYVTGVEVGLDSNGRKNRGGNQMENLVERYLKKSQIKYRKQMKLSEIEKLWNIDLSAISSKGTTNKRWDFAIKTKKCIYVIETNFYTSGGSKLNETARSYKMIAEEAKNIKNFEFVWITDGQGWEYAKNNLKETFNILKNLYNISDMDNGIFDTLFL